MRDSGGGAEQVLPLRRLFSVVPFSREKPTESPDCELSRNVTFFFAYFFSGAIQCSLLLNSESTLLVMLEFVELEEEVSLSDPELYMVSPEPLHVIFEGFDFLSLRRYEFMFVSESAKPSRFR